eukprot:3709236-Rhodomonas_salina.2
MAIGKPTYLVEERWWDRALREETCCGGDVLCVGHLSEVLRQGGLTGPPRPPMQGGVSVENLEQCLVLFR